MAGLAALRCIRPSSAPRNNHQRPFTGILGNNHKELNKLLLGQKHKVLNNLIESHGLSWNKPVDICVEATEAKVNDTAGTFTDSGKWR